MMSKWNNVNLYILDLIKDLVLRLLFIFLLVEVRGMGWNEWKSVVLGLYIDV